ncbi:MAG: hypothetical protein ABSB35_33880 [Bryobacteraceae bacterium]|jgi:hypothetical protein
MFYRAAILCFSCIAFAQTPPSKVDQALRTRVTEFLQDHVDGNFRKAFGYVADDTKDYYFGAQKTQYQSFHIDKIDYSNRFTKAQVHATVEHIWTFQGQSMPVKTAMVMTWVLEGGKWYWHYDPSTEAATPMGKSDPKTLKPDPNAASASAANLTPEAIAAKARQILGQSSVDKPEVVFATDKASSDQVVFHNGYPGSVRMVVNSGTDLPGFHVQVDKAEVAAGEDAVVKLSYEPADPNPKPSITVRLTIEPFNQVFNVAVKFGVSAQ